MLGAETATLRASEDPYGVVVPARSKGEQRVCSRDELEKLRFVVALVANGTTPAAAQALLADRSRTDQTPSGDDPDSIRIVVLLAERDRYAAELLEYFLRTEGHEVCVALEPQQAERLFADRRPHLSIIELMMSGGGLELCARLASDVPRGRRLIVARRGCSACRRGEGDTVEGDRCSQESWNPVHGPTTLAGCATRRGSLSRSCSASRSYTRQITV